MYHTDSRYRVLWGGDALLVVSAEAFAARFPAVEGLAAMARRPCLYEGPIVEACATCNGAAAERRAVRACLHPAPVPDRDLCVREHPRSSLQQCWSCPQRAERG